MNVICRVRVYVYLLYCFRVYIVSDGNVKLIMLLLLTVYTCIGKKIKPSMPRVVLIIFFSVLRPAMRIIYVNCAAHIITIYIYLYIIHII